MPLMPRSSLDITFSVWRALLLREALTRISKGRASWVWLLLEPVVHMAFMVVLLTIIRHRMVAGIDAAIWVIVGMLGFFTFRRTGMQGMNGISANQALFSYRQVRPVDTVLVRVFLEGCLMLLVAFSVLAAAALFGKPVVPVDPLAVLGAVFGLWFLGLGFALVFSVPNELIQEFEHILKFLMMPLYLISGVVFPIVMVPYPYRDWLMLNPIVHGLESARLGYADYYHVPDGVSLSYLFQSGLFLVVLGLALHVRFARRLIAR